MSAAWWAAFSPAETQISCGDSRHRLRWSDGTLQAIDHPDAEGELVLAALGGEASPCLDLVMAWGRHGDDLTVLAAGPRSADDRLTVTESTVEGLTGGPGGLAGRWPGRPAGPALISRHSPQARGRAAYGRAGAPSTAAAASLGAARGWPRAAPGAARRCGGLAPGPGVRREAGQAPEAIRPAPSSCTSSRSGRRSSCG